MFRTRHVCSGVFWRKPQYRGDIGPPLFWCSFISDQRTPAIVANRFLDYCRRVNSSRRPAFVTVLRCVSGRRMRMVCADGIRKVRKTTERSVQTTTPLFSKHRNSITTLVRKSFDIVEGKEPILVLKPLPIRTRRIRLDQNTSIHDFRFFSTFFPGPKYETGTTELERTGNEICAYACYSDWHTRVLIACRKPSLFIRYPAGIYYDARIIVVSSLLQFYLHGYLCLLILIRQMSEGRIIKKTSNTETRKIKLFRITPVKQYTGYVKTGFRGVGTQRGNEYVIVLRKNWIKRIGANKKVSITGVIGVNRSLRPYRQKVRITVTKTDKHESSEDGHRSRRRYTLSINRIWENTRNLLVITKFK